ncbi:MAG: alginate export family protein [Pirellulales bacterium]
MRRGLLFSSFVFSGLVLSTPMVLAQSAVEPAAITGDRAADAPLPAELAVDEASEADANFTGLISHDAAEWTAEASAETNAEGAPADGPNCCDPKKKAALKKSIAGAYAGVFYDNNFEYLCDPCYNGWHLGEDYKRMPVGDCWSVDVGGQYRIRYHNEHNIRGLGLTGRDDQFLLHRTRLYANAEYGNFFRAYVEGIDAESNYENFNPRPIEVDRSDLLNAFVDVKLHDGDSGELWARVGRQELLYGNQRLVSPLDWGNTRRTFDGYKLMWKGEDWNADVFWTQPVPVDPHNFNNPDQSQEFLGAYTTYKGAKNQTFDFYFLRFSESSAATEFDFNTFGARWSWKSGDWLAETEGMYQFGEFGGVNHSAGAFVTGVGHDFPCTVWKPTLWAYYDWSSGDDTIGNAFHDFFPLGHKYWGWMDLYGFRNLEDLNFQLTAKPSDKVKVIGWWHILNLQDGNDVPYTAAMTPFTVTPGGDQELGQELDFIISWAATDRLSVDLGYSHFFTGDWYSTNPTPNLFNGDADFYYIQAQLNF